MHTFSLTDTGNYMTKDPNFAVVSLIQGVSETHKCTVNLEIFTEQDLIKIE